MSHQACQHTVQYLQEHGLHFVDFCVFCKDRNVNCRVGDHKSDNVVWSFIKWCGNVVEALVLGRRGAANTPIKVDFKVDALRYDPDSLPFIDRPLLTKVPGWGLPFPAIMTDSFDGTVHDDVLTIHLGSWLLGSTGGGEQGMIGRNDGLLNALQKLSACSAWMRNVHHDSVSNVDRADRTITHQNVALVIVEEKDINMQECRGDLRKAVWRANYFRLPFIFGFAITKDNLEIHTLHSDGSINPIFASPCNTSNDRARCIIAMVNVARVIKSFIADNLFIPTLYSFGKFYTRRDKQIKLEPLFVEVKFTDHNLYKSLKKVYEKLGDAHHIERPYCRRESPRSWYADATRSIYLCPLGVERRPTSAAELRTAIGHIVEALATLHGLKHVHTDIRWPNIVEFRDDWYLIDLTDVVPINTVAHNQRGREARDLKDSTSTVWPADFDWYQVGNLIVEMEQHKINIDAFRDFVLFLRAPQNIQNTQSVRAALDAVVV